jgi:hypothetical protein
VNFFDDIPAFLDPKVTLDAPVDFDVLADII